MNLDASKVCADLKELLQQRVSEISYNTWFSGLKPVTIENDRILIMETPLAMAIDIIEKRYSDMIRMCFDELGLSLTFKIYNEGTYTSAAAQKLQQEVVIHDKAKTAGLNPRYTFENFISGSNNNLAFASALAVAELPGQTYNPLYIWGAPGLGKTHLMQSIAHRVLTTNPDKKVLYVTSETFTNELISAIATSTTADFRKKYRQIDVLLIDDIQFIGGKEQTQVEFFHTFNALYESGNQIVISGDRPPEEIQLLEERMRSRFKSGMVADIKAPDYETRVAILQKKAELNNINIDISVLSYIANNISSNIRELEGALTRVNGYARLYPNKKIDITLAQEALKDYIGNENSKEITVPRIIDIVCERYDIRPEDIRSKKKPKEIVYPRQIAMYLSRKMTEESLSAIGSYFGGRDHTTIIHACNKIADDLKGPGGEELRRSIEDMERRINGE